MRFEQHQSDKLRLTLEVVVSGVGRTGLNPEIAIKRNTDGHWLQAGGGSWGAGYATNVMIEVNAVDLAGLYDFLVPSARLSYVQDIDGYYVQMADSTVNVLEYVNVEVQEVAWAEAEADWPGAGTFGETVQNLTKIVKKWGAQLTGTPSTAGFDTDLTEASDYWNDAIVVVTSGAAAGQARRVKAYHNTNGKIDLHADLSVAPGATDTFMLLTIPSGEPAGAVWDALTSAHTTVGSFGEMAKQDDAMLRRGLLMSHGDEVNFLASAPHAGGDKFYLGGGGDPTPAVTANWAARLGLVFKGGFPSTNVVPVIIDGILNDGTDYFAVRTHDGGSVPGGVAAADGLIAVNTANSSYLAEGVWKTPLWQLLTDGTLTPAEAKLHIGPVPADGGAGTTMATIVWGLMGAMMRGQTDGSGSATTHFEADAIGTTTKFYHLHNLPAAGSTATWEQAEGTFIRRTTGTRHPIVVTAVANDGDEHFVLALSADGTSPLPFATAVGDQLVLSNLPPGLTAEELMEHPMSTYASVGTFGNMTRRILGLRQENMRTVYTAWNTAGQPTDGYVLLYDSKADKNADAAPWALATGRYDFDAAYDGSLRLTEYTSERTS